MFLEASLQHFLSAVQGLTPTRARTKEIRKQEKNNIKCFYYPWKVAGEPGVKLGQICSIGKICPIAQVPNLCFILKNVLMSVMGKYVCQYRDIKLSEYYGLLFHFLYCIIFTSFPLLFVRKRI